MMSKKFKPLASLLLSIIYISILCLSSFSFATASSEIVYSQKYYIKNCQTGLFMGGLDYYSIVQTSYEPDTDWQKWEFEFYDNGYCRIKNLYSGYYLTAPSSLEPNEMVMESSLSSSDDGQLWSLAEFAVNIDGTYNYAIIAKTWEGTELLLAGSNTSTMYGYPVVQDYYTPDSDYSDEWELIPIQDVYLVGINNTSAAHDHTSKLSSMEYYFANDYCDVTTVNTSSTTAYTVKNYIKNSDLFILRSCGYYDDIGTYMNLNPSDAMTKLHSWDIYNYNGNTGINLSRCALAIFAGCYTADHETQSLPQAAVDAGADCAIGFHGDPNCSEISKWASYFSSEYTSNGKYVESAAYEAARNCDDINVFNFEIFN